MAKKKKAELKVEYVPIEKLRMWEGNPRQNEESVESIIASIKAWGFDNPIIVRRANNEIIAGHTRVKALKAIGETHAPVIFRDLGEVDAHVRSVFDNKSVENTDWDFPKLADAFVDFDQMNVDMDLTGFTLDEILDIAPSTFEPQTEDDAVPEPPEEPVSKTGDLWLMGKHRLLCGDATKKDDVDRLMGGEKADMVFTDPPYGVDYGGHGNPRWSEKHRPIKNDGLDADAIEMFWVAAFRNISVWASGDLYVAASSGPPNQILAKALEQTTYTQHQWLIWVKNNFVLGRSNYHYRHEHLWYGWRQGAVSSFCGGRAQDSVWEIERPCASECHPTMKPVALIAKAIENSSKRKQRVLDTFLGSGTTLIAAEKLDRACYGMEIEPRYVDVAVKRWEEYTGKKAQLSNGK
jgi:DNA modification methylase